MIFQGNLITNRLVIGTAQFGFKYGVANESGKLCQFEGESILSCAYQSGTDFLDTAIGYGDCEATLGRIGVGQFKVISKLPPVPDGVINVPAWLDKQVAGSLSRLRLNSLYGLLLHCSESLMGDTGQQVADALRGVKSRGLVKKIGVSIYDPCELDYVTHALVVDLVQAPLNLVDRRLEASGWLSRLKEMGVEVHTRSVFLQGLLLMPREKIPARFGRWAHLLDAWAYRLKELGVSPVGACLGYPLSLPEVDRVVVGFDSLSQLTELLHEVKKKPKTENWDFMTMDDEKLINPSRWSEL